MHIGTQDGQRCRFLLMRSGDPNNFPTKRSRSEYVGNSICHCSHPGWDNLFNLGTYVTISNQSCAMGALCMRNVGLWSIVFQVQVEVVVTSRVVKEEGKTLPFSDEIRCLIFSWEMCVQHRGGRLK